MFFGLKLDRRINVVHAVVDHNDIAGGDHLEQHRADLFISVRIAAAGKVRLIVRRIRKVSVSAARNVHGMIRNGVELVRFPRLREICRKVGGVIKTGVRIVSVVQHHFIGGHCAAVDPHVFQISGEVRVAVVVSVTPLIRGVPAGTAQVVIVIGADLAQNVVQIFVSACFRVSGGILNPVDPIGDRCVCNTNDDVIGLSGFKRRGAVRRSLDVFVSAAVHVTDHRRDAV